MPWDRYKLWFFTTENTEYTETELGRRTALARILGESGYGCLSAASEFAKNSDAKAVPCSPCFQG